MKIKMLQSCGGNDFSFAKGDEADVEDRIGNDLIQAGYAESIEEKKAPTKTESATVEPPRQATDNPNPAKRTPKK